MKRQIRNDYKQRLATLIEHVKNNPKFHTIQALYKHNKVSSATMRAFIVQNYFVYDKSESTWVFSDNGHSNAQIIRNVRRAQNEIMRNWTKNSGQTKIKFKAIRKQPTFFSILKQRIKSFFV